LGEGQIAGHADTKQNIRKKYSFVLWRLDGLIIFAEIAAELKIRI
jgi:hypothetical protein